jgi:hypothetical protein
MRLPPWVNFDAPLADLQQPGALGWCTLADGRQIESGGQESSGAPINSMACAYLPFGRKKSG